MSSRISMIAPMPKTSIKESASQLSQLIAEAGSIKKELVQNSTAPSMFRDSVMRQQMEHCEHIEPVQVFGPFIVKGTLTVLFGHAKIGKSIVMLQVALGIARGKATHALPNAASRVLYIDLENKDERSKADARLQLA